MKINRKVNLVKDTPDRLYRYKHLYKNDVHCYKKLGIKGNFYLLLKICIYFFYGISDGKKHKK